MERKQLTRERANTYGRKKSLRDCTRRTPSLIKEISRKKSAEDRIDSHLPIRQGQPSVEQRAYSKHQSFPTVNHY